MRAPPPRTPGDGGGAQAPSRGPIPFVLSAKSEPALRAQAARLAAHLEQSPSWTSPTSPTPWPPPGPSFEQRAVVVADRARAAARRPSRRWPPGDPAPSRHRQRQRRAGSPTSSPARAPSASAWARSSTRPTPPSPRRLTQACAALDPHLDGPLKELIFADRAPRRRSCSTTPPTPNPPSSPPSSPCTACSSPAASSQTCSPATRSGEIAAAHIAGVLSLDDAAKLIGARGALMGALPAGGAMLAIEATEQEVAGSIEGKEERSPSPRSTAPAPVVISGDRGGDRRSSSAHWQEQGRKTKRLAVSHAFHSPLIEPMLEPFARSSPRSTLSEPSLPVISNAHRRAARPPSRPPTPPTGSPTPREPVRFADAVETLSEPGRHAPSRARPRPASSPRWRRSALGEEDDRRR